MGIAACILWLLTVMVGDPSRTGALLGAYPVLGIWWSIDLLWALNYTLWLRRQPATTR